MVAATRYVRGDFDSEAEAQHFANGLKMMEAQTSLTSEQAPRRRPHAPCPCGRQALQPGADGAEPAEQGAGHQRALEADFNKKAVEVQQEAKEAQQAERAKPAVKPTAKKAAPGKAETKPPEVAGKTARTAAKPSGKANLRAVPAQKQASTDAASKTAAKTTAKTGTARK